jgi:hypothetical protein
MNRLHVCIYYGGKNCIKPREAIKIRKRNHRSQKNAIPKKTKKNKKKTKKNKKKRHNRSKA